MKIALTTIGSEETFNHILHLGLNYKKWTFCNNFNSSLG
jgi:hypothetical protein